MLLDNLSQLWYMVISNFASITFWGERKKFKILEDKFTLFRLYFNKFDADFILIRYQLNQLGAKIIS